MSGKSKGSSGGGLRKAFLASKDSRKKQRVQWTAPDGKVYPVDIIEPTSKQRGAIRKAAMTIRGEDIDFDQTELEIWAVIVCAHDPETGEAIFDAADHDALLEVGSQNMDVLARPAMSYMGQSPEVEAKN